MEDKIKEVVEANKKLTEAIKRLELANDAKLNIELGKIADEDEYDEWLDKKISENRKQ